MEDFCNTKKIFMTAVIKLREGYSPEGACEE